MGIRRRFLGGWIVLGLLLSLVSSSTGMAEAKYGRPADSRVSSLSSSPQVLGVTQVRETTSAAAARTSTGMTARTGLGQSSRSSGTTLPPAVWNLTEEEPLVLTGYSNSASYDVILPDGWQISGSASFAATMVASAVANADAAVRIDIADRPAVTWNPSVEDQLQLPIAPELFADPFTIAASTTSPLDSEDVFECIDRSHVARWFDLGLPRVEANIQPDDLDIARAMSGMGQISMLTSEPITVVLETEATPAMLESLGSIVAGVSQHALPAGWVIHTDGKSPTDSGAIVYLRETADEPGQISLSVKNDRPELSLTGSSESLVLLADALADVDRLTYMHAVEISETEIPSGQIPAADEVFSFHGAGYDDRTLRGVGSQALVYRLHLPAGVPPDSATLALYATHAPALAEQGATVSVQINGSAEEIVAIVDDSGQLKVLHTVTPADLRPGLNYLKLRIELGRAGGTCEDAAGTNWLAVSNNSGIGVDTPSRPVPVEIGVEDARFALATTVDFEQTDVAVSDNYDADDLAVAVEVISRLANRSQGGSPRLTIDSLVDDQRHLVVSGASRDRQLLDSVPYLDEANQVGLVAAKPSPFEQGRVYLAFTGGTSADAMRAVEAAMSSEVNDIDTPYALIGRDEVRRVGDAPTRLAFDDEGRVVGPEPAEYDDWLVEQATRIEAAREPERDRRRAVALALAFLVAAVVAAWWLKRARSNDDVASGH